MSGFNMLLNGDGAIVKNYYFDASPQLADIWSGRKR